MRIALDITKTIDENAQVYFEKAKKFKKKIEGAKVALALHEKKLAQLSIEEKKKEEKKVVSTYQRQWYEKFRWFVSTEGFLCISGMDATTNEVVVKKHMDPTDVVLHTDMAGSPFTIVKCTASKTPTEVTLNQAAQFTQGYSRGWKSGMSSIPVFHVLPEQVSKTPNPGEFIGKGSFIIRGKTNYLHPIMEICVGVAKEGVHKERIIAGTKDIMEKETRMYAVLRPGSQKSSDMAKELLKKFQLQGNDHLDDLIKFIPPGGAEVKEIKKLRV